MYKRYFNFNKLPFSIVPDPEFLYLSPRHREGLETLLYGITMSDGFVILTGEIGTGKTTICRDLLEKLPDNIDIALVLNPRLCAVELLATICDELGINYQNQNLSLKVLIDLLNQHLLETHAKGKRTVLLIDEAQNLSGEVLEQIRLLTNLETTQVKLLQIVLVGQPELNEKLNQYKLRQLNQRVTARYHLCALTLAETRHYIHYRLSVSGGDPGLFTDKAINRIYKLTQGVPRLINILCDRSLLGAYANGEVVIKPDIVNRAAREVRPNVSRRKFPFRRAGMVVAILLIMVVAGGYYVDKDRNTGMTKQVQTHADMVTADVATASLMDPLPLITETRIIQEKPSQSFSDFISDPELTLERALTELLKIWALEVHTDKAVDCSSIRQAGLRCLLDQNNWKNMLALNRPAILEFSLGGKEKRYLLLTGIEQGQPVFQFRDKEVFPLEEVLSHWQGKFLVVWQVPYKGMGDIFPRKASEDVLWLRKKIAAIYHEETDPEKNPKFYDKSLEKKVKAFQKQYDLAMDGVVGSRTIIHLQNLTENHSFPTIKKKK